MNAKIEISEKNSDLIITIGKTRIYLYKQSKNLKNNRYNSVIMIL